jgi:hypothetical protein
MILPAPSRFLKKAAATLVALGLAALLGAAPLLPVRVTAQGQVPAGPDGQLAVIDGVPVVLAGDRMWRQDGAGGWREQSWQPDGGVVGIFGDGRTAFALFAEKPSGPIQRVRQLLLADGRLASRDLPPLPAPLQSALGAVKDTRLFVHGVDATGATQLYVLALSEAAPGWRHHAGSPGAAGRVEALTAQQDSLYAVVTPADDTGQRLYRWSPAQSWMETSRLPGKLVPSALRATGQAHLIGVVGDAAGQRMVSYYAITQVWAELGGIDARGLRPGAPWGNGFLLAQDSGGNLALSLAELVPTKQLLRPLDWVMIFLYLGLIAGIGVYCYRQEQKKSTASFFVGSRTIPFWAAGISLYATNSSSIGYIATTAKAFATNWQYLVGNLLGALGLVFVAIWIVPLLRRLELMSVFTYLDQRFHRSVRLAASAFCIVMHMGGRLSVILFLPSLAIATITGLDVIWSILIMGLVTIGYTALGGMRAVIWTDLAQVIVKVGGLVFAVGFIAFKLKGGVPEFISIAQADDKLKMFDWSFDLTKATVWCFIFSYAARDRADLSQGPDPDAAGLHHEIREGGRPLGLGLCDHRPARELSVLPDRHRPVCVLSHPPRAHEPAAAGGRDISALHRGGTARGCHRVDDRRALFRRHGHELQHPEQRLHHGLSGFLREDREEARPGLQHQAGGVGHGDCRPHRHRPGHPALPFQHQLVPGHLDRAGRPVRRLLWRGLHARHVHAPGQLAGSDHRHDRQLRGHLRGLVGQPGASVPLSRGFHLGVDRGGLRGQLPFPAAARRTGRRAHHPHPKRKKTAVPA